MLIDESPKTTFTVDDMNAFPSHDIYPIRSLLEMSDFSQCNIWPQKIEFCDTNLSILSEQGSPHERLIIWQIKHC